jgi:hypothetical protein
MAHTAIALGTLSGGWRIIHTVGSKITKLQPLGGFTAETAGAITISRHLAWVFLSRPLTPSRGQLLGLDQSGGYGQCGGQSPGGSCGHGY